MSLILHLSDLHLGPEESGDVLGDYKSEIVPLPERITRQDLLRETLKKLAVRLKTETRSLDAVVITGDITIRGREEGFQQLEGILECLGEIRPRADQVVVVPGNHDVAWAPPDDPRERYKHFISYVRAKGYKTPLLEGIDLTGTKPTPDDLKNHYLIGPTRNWAILPINSSNYCGKLESIGGISDPDWTAIPDILAAARPSFQKDVVTQTLKKLRLHDIARISKDQFSAIEWLVAAINAAAVGSMSSNPLLVVAMHHHLLPVTDLEEFKSYESITNLGHLRHVLRENNVSVMLHGHKHIEYVYTDHIYEMPEADPDSVHRMLVVAGATVGAKTYSQNQVCRLLEIGTTNEAPTIAISHIPVAPQGIPLKIPPAKVFPLWQKADAFSLRSGPVHLVEGNSVDNVYERALSLFKPANSAEWVSNLICRVGETPESVTLPRMYPVVQGVPADEREAWFKRIVDWWQKRDFKKLSGDHHFNHGNRIFRYEREIDQLNRVVEAIERDPLTSRGVVSLLKPEADQIHTDARFPSFSLIQFLVRDLRDSCMLDIVAFFRKQEIRYWWPVNLAELSRLQLDVFNKVKDKVGDKLKRPLKRGSVTTLATLAHVGTDIPFILVPAIDFDLEESPQKLWDMTYAVCWENMATDRRKDQITTWVNVLSNLVPPKKQDSAGVPVPIQGIEYLAELSEHLARNHNGEVHGLAVLWRELEKINTRHGNKMNEGKVSEQEHNNWRIDVLANVNRIRDIIIRVFNATIQKFE